MFKGLDEMIKNSTGQKTVNVRGKKNHKIKISTRLLKVHATIFEQCIQILCKIFELCYAIQKKNMVLLYFENDIRVLRAFVFLCSFLLGEIFEIFIPGIIQHYPQRHDYFNKV
jgi:hypothetical protein